MNYVLQQNIPVVTFDTRVHGAVREVRMSASTISKAGGSRPVGDRSFPDGAKVLHLTGLPGSSTGIDRAKGVREGLAAAGSKYKLVGEASANWSRAEAMMVAEGQLTFLPEPPNAIVADNDDMALGAIEAIRRRVVTRTPSR